MKTLHTLPDFIIIGAAKCATTSLFKSLGEHPEIFTPQIKEPEFFSDPRKHKLGLNWYTSLFEKKQEHQICGEASTTYSRWPHTLDSAALIHSAVPNVKLIYIMRNPLDRAYSHYCHHMRLKITMTFEQAIDKDSIYLDCSNYMLQINRYLRYFQKKNILFLTFDEYKSNTHNLLKRVLDFLELVPCTNTKIKKIHSNERHQEYIRSRTTGWIRKVPGGNTIADSFTKERKKSIHNLIRRSKLGNFLEKSHNIPQMREETKQKLEMSMAPEISQLEDFIDMDLSHWKKGDR